MTAIIPSLDSAFATTELATVFICPESFLIVLSYPR
jgi:hypothetical protein